MKRGGTICWLLRHAVYSSPDLCLALCSLLLLLLHFCKSFVDALSHAAFQGGRDLCLISALFAILRLTQVTLHALSCEEIIKLFSDDQIIG